MSTSGLNVTLRQAVPEDASLIEGWVSAYEDIKFMPGLYDERAKLAHNWKHLLESEKLQHVYIVESADKKPVGMCLLYNHQKEIGSIFTGTIVPSKGVSGVGAASAAHKLLLEIAFKQPNVKNVHSKVYGKNLSAIKRMKEIGYVEVLRKPDIYSESNAHLGDMLILRVTPETWVRAT